MEKDPHSEVSNMAKALTDYVRNKVVPVDMLKLKTGVAHNFISRLRNLSSQGKVIVGEPIHILRRATTPWIKPYTCN